MRPRFNVAGPCFPGEHYMLPPERRLGRVMELIDDGLYFTLHAGRQTGKTTSVQWLTDHYNGGERVRGTQTEADAQEQVDGYLEKAGLAEGCSWWGAERGDGLSAGAVLRSSDVPTIGDDASTRAGVEEPAAPPASAASPADTPGEDETPFPPALIVGLRAPDRAVARIIGDMTPAQARLGAVVTFGISPAGRHAERAAAGAAKESPAQVNVLSLPHPRISPLPTRVATTSADGADGSNEP